MASPGQPSPWELLASGWEQSHNSSVAYAVRSISKRTFCTISAKAL